MLVTTKRGLSLGCLPSARTTSALLNDATFPRPGLARPVRTLTVNMLGLPRGLRLTTRLFHCWLGFALQHRIGRQIDEIFHFRLAVQKFQNFRCRETAI